jgi:hypothetical protein
VDARRLADERWWRVELNKAGTVTACEPVENCERNTRHVLYIQAACEQHAVAEAERWLERRREYARQYDRKRRRARQAKGICEACDRKIAANSKTCCAEHLIAARDYQRTRKARIAAGIVRPITNPVVARAQEDARQMRFRRMTVQLPVVLAVYDQLDGRLWSPFRQWLVDEIAARGGDSQREQAAAE